MSTGGKRLCGPSNWQFMCHVCHRMPYGVAAVLRHHQITLLRQKCSCDLMIRATLIRYLDTISLDPVIAGCYLLDSPILMILPIADLWLVYFSFKNNLSGI